MQNHKLKRAAVFGALAAAWIGVLFFFSGQPGQESGELSRKLTLILFKRWIENGADVALLEMVLRKTAHFGIFAVEGFLFALTMLCLFRRKIAVVWTMAGCAMLAVGNELHQLTTLERSCNVRDMFIDWSGSAAGMLAALALWALAARRRKRNQERITTGD